MDKSKTARDDLDIFYVESSPGRVRPFRLLDGNLDEGNEMFDSSFRSRYEDVSVLVGRRAHEGVVHTQMGKRGLNRVSATYLDSATLGKFFRPPDQDKVK